MLKEYHFVYIIWPRVATELTSDQHMPEQHYLEIASTHCNRLLFGSFLDGLCQIFTNEKILFFKQSYFDIVGETYVTTDKAMKDLRLRTLRPQKRVED